MKGECYSVDVKLLGIVHGDQAAADLRVTLAGLDVTWLISMEPKKASAEVLLFRPKGGTGTGGDFTFGGVEALSLRLLHAASTHLLLA